MEESFKDAMNKSSGVSAAQDIEFKKGYVKTKHKYLPFVDYVDLKLDENKGQYGYERCIGEQEDDYGYLLHYAKDGFTQGCIGILEEEDAISLASIIDYFRETNDGLIVKLNVV